MHVIPGSVLNVGVEDKATEGFGRVKVKVRVKVRDKVIVE